MKKILYLSDYVIMILVTVLLIVLVLYLRSQDALPESLNLNITNRLSFDHVFIIVMENREYDEVIGNQNEPYINSLAKKYAVSTDFYAVTHPSLPNYIALTSGSTQKITTDCNTCFLKEDNIFQQLEQQGKTWKAYLEQMPDNCYLADYENYVVHHNPAVYFLDLRKSCQKNDVPFQNLSYDLENNTVADLSFISPDNLNNMHSGTEQMADAWLKNQIPRIMNSNAFTKNSVIFITWDEGKISNHIPLLIISSLAKPGYTSTNKYSLYSLLATIEDSFGLPRLGNAGGSSTLNEFFKTTKQ